MSWEKWDQEHRPTSASRLAKGTGADWVDRESENLRKLHPGLKLHVHRASGGHVVLSSVVVPKGERQGGVGSHVMQHLTRHADAHGDTMALTPSKDFGGTVSRLKTFYGRYGFKLNTGRSRDLSISETMIREPKR